MNLYEKIYSILKEHWDDDALEFFWTRDETSSAEEVAGSLCKEVENESTKAMAAAGSLLWSYGNGADDLETAKQMILSAYLGSTGLEKKMYKKELDQIDEEIDKKRH